MDLIRSVRPPSRLARRSRVICTPYGRAKIEILGRVEIADADGAKARILQRLHGFRAAEPGEIEAARAALVSGASGTAEGAAPETAQPPSLRGLLPGDAEVWPVGARPRIDDLAALLRSDDIDADLVARALRAEGASARPRVGAEALLWGWLEERGLTGTQIPAEPTEVPPIAPAG